MNTVLRPRSSWIFVGNDWAEDHHDVHVMGQAGRKLAVKRLVEGIDGIRFSTPWSRPGTCNSSKGSHMGLLTGSLRRRMITQN